MDGWMFECLTGYFVLSKVSRLPGEEAAVQISEGQTEPHQEEGERLRQGLKDTR